LDQPYDVTDAIIEELHQGPLGFNELHLKTRKNKNCGKSLFSSTIKQMTNDDLTTKRREGKQRQIYSLNRITESLFNSYMEDINVNKEQVGIMLYDTKKYCDRLAKITLGEIRCTKYDGKLLVKVARHIVRLSDGMKLMSLGLATGEIESLKPKVTHLQSLYQDTLQRIFKMLKKNGATISVLISPGTYITV